MMLQQPMTCSVPSQHKMAPPMSAMALRDATTTVMSNMAQQQPMMSTPDVNKMPASTDVQVPEVYNHQVTYCVDNEACYDNFFDEQENNQFMSNDEIQKINFDNYQSSNLHISKQQEILYLQNLVSAYASIGTHPCYSYRKTSWG